MEESYQFKCLECELEFIIEKITNLNQTFFCDNCNKTSKFYFCKDCNQICRSISNPQKERKLQFPAKKEEFKVKCPNCSSDHVIRVPLAEWMMDYQIW